MGCEIFDTGIIEYSQRTMRNRKRGNKITSYARQNAKTYKELDKYLLTMDSSGKAFMYAANFRAKLQSCCSHTLVREHHSPKTYEFIAAHTCKHKMCHVCNSERSRVLRRKYGKYFDANEFVDRKTGEVLTKDDFDFMHLTLTVPHDENGYRGQKWYAQELIQEFNFMRKKAFWQKHVFAGEFGVEVTKNNNGLHIHIHALLLVNKAKQNRNDLHAQILVNWNNQTAMQGDKTPVNDERLEAIKKSNKTLSESALKRLLTTGSTMVSLENLYVYNRTKTHYTDKWNDDLKKWKHYVNTKDSKELMAGVMECIKYHFEPLCLNKSTGEYDFDLMAEILPAIVGKPLYRKFGNWHGVKQLNIIESREDNEMLTDLEDTANTEVLHPVTNQVLQQKDYRYLVIQAKRLFYDRNDNLKPVLKKFTRKRYLTDVTLPQALKNMLLTGANEAIKLKGRDKHYLALHAAFDDEKEIF